MDYFSNRELSWLKFNYRVMQEADHKDLPILERMKFLAITSSNLDEFFMIRVAGLQHQLESDPKKKDIAGMTASEQLDRISGDVHDLVKTQYRHIKSLQKELEQEKIFFGTIHGLSKEDQAWCYDYFRKTVYPVVTPVAVDASHPFPFLANRSLNIALKLSRSDGEDRVAVVQVPSVLPRIVEVPGQVDQRVFLFLEDIIQEYCHELFYGYEVKESVTFRITRNADLTIDEEDAEDLLEEVERSLRQRKRGQPVRLEVHKTSHEELANYIIDALKIQQRDIYEIPGPLDVTCYFKFLAFPGLACYQNEPYLPQIPQDLVGVENLFEVLQERDILLHHPYESFDPVVQFVQQAAADPKVLAIKQTLYRVSGNSPIVKALAQAAENGKQVTVLVELKARFDEENNIIWARRLEEAGCHVIYGLMGLKTHAKCILVVRLEDSGIRRYVHMGTGNYNDSTAKLYTDMGLLTSNDQFGADASAFFNVLSGYSDPPVWNKVAVAPLGLREKIHQILDQAMEAAEQGEKARVIAKMNALVDKDIIMKLYEASQRGVQIDLIIRGICVLLPGIPGVSENITVRSIVGRFLEHHRIIYCQYGHEEKVYLSSADWMPRNLNQRVELLFPIDAPKHIVRIREMLQLLLADNQKAHTLRKDGLYRRVAKRGTYIDSQRELMEMAQNSVKKDKTEKVQTLVPMYRKDTNT